MKKRPVIYVRRVTNLSDARYCAGMGVELLGFAVNPAHEDYVSPQQYQEMNGWIAGPIRVAELTDGDSLSIQGVIAAYAPQILHLSMEEIGNPHLQGHPLMVEVSIKSLVTTQSTLLVSGLDIQYVLVTGITANNVSELLDMKQDFPLLLSIDARFVSVHALVQETKVAGISLLGTREELPGLKDYDHLSEILEEFQE